MLKIQAGVLFTIKCLMKKNPLVVILVIYILSIPYFGFMLRIAEHPLERLEGTTMIFNYANAMWCTIVSMATSI